ncbi:hypothetical protein V6N12_040275 [Hibiscus sabdariffa]|uniref:Uncharacterized protein n=1 Tax=Hibiscus sabdariffa TaxID=183260 RepID=A0ABR2E382_9ROSI
MVYFRLVPGAGAGVDVTFWSVVITGGSRTGVIKLKEIDDADARRDWCVVLGLAVAFGDGLVAAWVMRKLRGGRCQRGFVGKMKNELGKVDASSVKSRSGIPEKRAQDASSVKSRSGIPEKRAQDASSVKSRSGIPEKRAQDAGSVKSRS